MSSENRDKVVMESLKDVKSMDKIDFEKIELQRGKTPDDMKEKCLMLRKEYLSGNWLSQTVDSIEVRRVSGGLTNQLYFCGITKPSLTSDVPQEVAVRLYGAKHINIGNETNERLNDVVIGLLVSDNGLGPKVYGFLEEGQIQHFYKNRPFKVEEQKDPALIRELFQKLTRVHAMDVPIRKQHRLLAEFDDMFGIVEKCMNNGLRDVLKEANCQSILDNDLKADIMIDDVYKLHQIFEIQDESHLIVFHLIL